MRAHTYTDTFARIHLALPNLMRTHIQKHTYTRTHTASHGNSMYLGASWHVRAAVVKVSAVCKEVRHLQPLPAFALSLLPCPPSCLSSDSLSLYPVLSFCVLLLWLRLRDNIVRLRCRVSPTPLVPVSPLFLFLP